MRGRSLQGATLVVVVAGPIEAWVACRTAEATGAVGVLFLAFPLQPCRSAESRRPELDQVTVPTLVVQGERDQFGVPPATALRTIVRIRGDHSLKTDLDAVVAAVGAWLRSTIATVRPGNPP